MKKSILLLSFLYLFGLFSVNARNPQKKAIKKVHADTGKPSRIAPKAPQKKKTNI